MGLSDKDIVALSGGHTLGKAHPERSGFDEKPWTKDPLKFDNSYFVELLKGDSNELLKLPTDKALVEDPKFRCYVELYAEATCERCLVVCNRPSSGYDRVISYMHVAETNRHMAVTARETSGVRTVAPTYFGIMV
ncbi:hypothetical protein R6Q57_015056 [Mikania cordata]